MIRFLLGVSRMIFFNFKKLLASHPAPRKSECESILQLKITLANIEPSIWRSIQIKDSLTFDDLHTVIQCIMPWDNDHLYNFHLKVDGKKFFIETSGDDFFMDSTFESSSKNGLLAHEVRLADYVYKEKQEFVYTYDFGDSWKHIIHVEKILPMETASEDPVVCIRGERNAPPEDCGGRWGYNECLTDFREHSDSEYNDQREWIGDWDPESFDLDAVNKQLKKFFKKTCTKAT